MVVGDQQVYRDLAAYQVTDSFFRPDAENPKACLVCVADVGDPPSIGVVAEEAA